MNSILAVTGKEKNCDSLLDMYIHALYQDVWNSAQADTQYQGVGRNHELAALLITETVQHSLFHHHLPVFLLFLDARSAFDRVVISFLIRNFYLNGIDGNSLDYLNNRLSNRVTVIEWDKELLGPINDEQGLEQGGCISSDGYKMYNNDLLKLLQKSHQGVQLGDGLVVSVVGQADDVALISNSIFNLYNLLTLTINYCKKFNIELCQDKTKLLMIKRSCDQSFVALNPIRINNKQINFSEQAEHVGIIRSTTGNLPNLMNRLACHKAALAANLFTGIARGHRGNLAAAIKVENVYARPALFSGLSSLVLTKAEVSIIDHYYQNTLRNLIKCFPGTPHSFILFASGNLPGQALLHLKQLGIFSMITHLSPSNPLVIRAKHSLLTGTKTWRSWFLNIRDTCLLYGMPHPLALLERPLPRERFK